MQVCNKCNGEGIINPDNDINTTILCCECDGGGRVDEVEEEVDDEVIKALDDLIASLGELAELIDSINQ